MRCPAKRSLRPSSFTLVELLTVITIIAILAALTIMAFSGVLKGSARSRAKAEIGALSTAMEGYKADNGGYPTPPTAIFTSTNIYTTASCSTPLPTGVYASSSAFLYQSLTGRTNFADNPSTAGTKIYYVFKASQLGNNTASAGQPIYIQDPFGYAYGYFPGNTTANPPFNGTGLFDLWSTAGDTYGTNAPSWVTDWNN